MKQSTHKAYSSDDQSDRVTSEVNRNYEVVECIDKITPNQCSNARDEHGDDEGGIFCVVILTSLTSIRRA